MTSENLPLPTQQVVVSNNVTLNSITSNDITTNWLNVPGTIGQVIMSNGLGGLTWGTGGGGVSSITGTANQINVNNIAGVVTLSLPQDIALTSSPTFDNLTLSGLGTGLLRSSSGVQGLVTIGTGISYNTNTNTLSNVGVLSIAGTANQINVNNVSGNIVLSLPQSIAITNNVQCARLLNSSISSNNLLLGTDSGLNITTGNSNVFIGDSAGSNITSGRYNTAIGHLAISNMSVPATLSGAENVAIGAFSLRTLKSAAIGNIGIGYASGESITTGSYNIIIGGASATTELTTASGCIYIGNSIYANNTSYECVINSTGESSIGRGSKTALIDTLNGVFTKSPLIAQYISTGYNSSNVSLFDVNPLSASRGLLIYNDGVFRVPVSRTGIYEVTYDGNFLFGSPSAHNIGVFIQLSTDAGTTWDNVVANATTHTTYLNNISIGCFIDMVQSTSSLIRVLFNTSSGYILPSGGTQYIRFKYIST